MSVVTLTATLGCAATSLPATSTDWLANCTHTSQELDTTWISIDDFDADGRAELLTADGGRLAAWDQTGDQTDAAFTKLAEVREPDGRFISGHALSLVGEPVVSRGWGDVLLLAWPELHPVATDERGSLHNHVLGRRLLVFGNRGTPDGVRRRDRRRPFREIIVFDPQSTRAEPLELAGKELDWVRGPGDTAIMVLDDDGKRSLAWLQAPPEGADPTRVTIQRYPWQRGASLLGAVELDEDPEPELIAVRRGRTAIVDLREGRWRWSAILRGDDRSLLGAAALAGLPGVSLVFGGGPDAMIVSGCSNDGCTHATSLAALQPPLDARGFIDATGTITWAHPDGIAQLRCPVMSSARAPR